MAIEPPRSAPPVASVRNVADAMRDVLDAERDAAQQMARCQAQCQAIVEAARLDARHIGERAETIAQAIHGRIDQVAAQRAECRREGPGASTTAPDDEHVAAAIARLAAALTGGNP